MLLYKYLATSCFHSTKIHTIYKYVKENPFYLLDKCLIKQHELKPGIVFFHLTVTAHPQEDVPRS